jgi:dephospho-CoA kinase
MYSLLKFGCKESIACSLLYSGIVAMQGYIAGKLNMIGLTGGIACGKSTVLSIVIQEFPKKFGVIDCDLISREVVRPGRYAYKKIVSHFGNEILLRDGTINRTALGNVVFNNREERNKLNRIIQPVILFEILKQIIMYKLKGYSNVILDAPLLYETRVLEHFCYPIIVVYIQNEDEWLERLMKRDSISKLDAKTKIECQMPISTKVQKADVVLNNSQSIGLLAEQVRRLLNSILN